MHDFGIENLSCFGLEPAALIRLAADLGCGHVSLSLSGSANPLDGLKRPALRDVEGLRSEAIAASRETGVRVSLLEGFTIAPGVMASDLASDLDIAAELGARAICAVNMDRDRPRAYAEIAALSEMAADRGIIVTTEFGAGTARNLERVLEMLAGVGHANFGLLIDTMHYFRTGATLSDLERLGIDSVRHIQLCDVPMPAEIDDYMEEALFERRAPGDGDLPLATFLGKIPRGVPVGLEIPIRSQAASGTDHHQRMARCLELARCLESC
jgi:sugar phosphate isomerase/epimerase